MMTSSASGCVCVCMNTYAHVFFYMYTHSTHTLLGKQRDNRDRKKGGETKKEREINGGDEMRECYRKGVSRMMERRRYIGNRWAESE